MATKSFFRLENLSVRADGLSSMAHAVRAQNVQPLRAQLNQPISVHLKEPIALNSTT